MINRIFLLIQLSFRTSSNWLSYRFRLRCLCFALLAFSTGCRSSSRRTYKGWLCKACRSELRHTPCRACPCARSRMLPLLQVHRRRRSALTKVYCRPVEASSVLRSQGKEAGLPAISQGQSRPPGYWRTRRTCCAEKAIRHASQVAPGEEFQEYSA